MESLICIGIVAFASPFFLVALRLINVLPAVQNGVDHHGKKLSDITKMSKGKSVMILLGSGGHTGEMLRLLENIDLSNLTRTWVISSTDQTSLSKGKAFEETHLQRSKYKPSYMKLPRAREVGQSIPMSIKNTVSAFISTYRQIWGLREKPSILLLNGPGTSVPLAFTVFFLKFLGLCSTRIIFIESLARVNQLSLSGLLVLPIADRFIVQWEKLSYKYKRAEYHGILI